MISNFNEVEKSLKRCLKEKVSITTATVVGFLIAGTVAFGGVAADTSSYDTASFTEAIEKVMENQNGLSVSKDTNLTGVKYIYEGTGGIIRLITVEGGTTILDDKTNISTEKKCSFIKCI